MKKKILGIILLFLSLQAAANKYSLEDISRTFLKAVSTQDTALLKPILINYADYTQLYQYFLSRQTKIKPIFSKDYMLNKEDFYVDLIKPSMSKFNGDVSAFDFSCPQWQTKGFSYLNYAYSVHISPAAYEKFAVITIYAKCDTSIYVFENIRCYAIDGGWKLAAFKFSFHKFWAGLATYDAWNNRFGAIHEEQLPLQAFEILWQQILADTSKPLDNKLIFSLEEFRDMLEAEHVPMDKVDLPLDYSRYIERLKNTIARMHDTISSLQFVHEPFYKNGIVGGFVVNCPKDLDGKNLRTILSNYQPFDTTSSGDTYLLKGFILFKKMSSTTGWKLSFMDCGFERHDFNNFELLRRRLPFEGFF